MSASKCIDVYTLSRMFVSEYIDIYTRCFWDTVHVDDRWVSLHRWLAFTHRIGMLAYLCIGICLDCLHHLCSFITRLIVCVCHVRLCLCTVTIVDDSLWTIPTNSPTLCWLCLVHFSGNQGNPGRGVWLLLAVEPGLWTYMDQGSIGLLLHYT